MEKNLGEETTEGRETIVSTLKALLETVEPTSKMIEVAVITGGNPVRYLTNEEIEEIVKEVEDEKAAKMARQTRETRSS